MKSKIVTALGLGVLLWAAPHATAQNSSNGSDNMNRDQMKMDKMRGGMMTAQQMNQKFVMDAMMGNLAEIKMSQAALDKLTNPELKNFAQMMIDHHTMANRDLMEAARMMGMTMNMPESLDPHHQAALDGMMKFSGAQFDMAYLKGQLADHALALDVHEMYVKKGKDRNLKSYAQKTAPVVKNHYEMAKGIDMQMAMAMMPDMMGR